MNGFDFERNYVGSSWGPDVDYPNRDESILEAANGIKAPDIKFKPKKMLERHMVVRVDIYPISPSCLD